jgi:hypothetical protein
MDRFYYYYYYYFKKFIKEKKGCFLGYVCEELLCEGGPIMHAKRYLGFFSIIYIHVHRLDMLCMSDMKALHTLSVII